MTLEEGKETFIQSWGSLGSSWGITRVMAQVHALLLISPEALCADDIMESLKISRGSANMHLRSLMDWGLVMKHFRAGERREYFYADKDMWQVVKNIIVHRKKKELEPMLRVLDDLSSVQGDSQEAEEFLSVVKEIKLFASKADSTLGALIKADSNWFTGTFLKMIR